MVASIKKLEWKTKKSAFNQEENIYCNTIFKLWRKPQVILCPLIDQWLKHDTIMLQNFETHGVNPYVLTRKKNTKTY